jgi:zinc/manganese transport system substrate-binding protein
MSTRSTPPRSQCACRTSFAQMLDEKDYHYHDQPSTVILRCAKVGRRRWRCRKLSSRSRSPVNTARGIESRGPIDIPVVFSLTMVIVFGLPASRLRELCLTTSLILGVAPALTGCTDTKSSTRTGASATGPCPVAPVNVVVSVDQWGDLVGALGGNCAKVKTVLVSSSVDPHDYQPSPADASYFSGSQLVVVNGADYDPWASKLATTTVPKVPLISAAAVTETPDGANPHLWYKPSAVTAVADAVTAELTRLSPSAAGYFATQRTTFTTDLKPYNALIAKIKAAASGKSYAATEGIFSYMANALGLVDRTPAGYRRAVANQTDPSPGDINAFRTALSNRQIDVLVLNPQTEGALPDQIRTAAQESGVPVVDASETVAARDKSFQSWQIDQLTSLARALNVPA